jgi:hypothetical protein
MQDGKETVRVVEEFAATVVEARLTSCWVESHCGPPTATNILYEVKLTGAPQFVLFVRVKDAEVVPTEIGVATMLPL